MQPISIIVTFWNGRELLEKYLPSVLRAARKYGDFQLLLVDDGSTDDSAEYVRKNFPEAEVHSLSCNSGSITAKNFGLRFSKYDIVVTLDSDLEILSEDFFSSLVPHFKDPELFAAIAKVLNVKSGMANETITAVKFERGLFKVIQPGVLNPARKFEDVLSIPFAASTASAYDKRKFLEIGGFDRLFYPGYDYEWDISYRAWKRGWKIMYEPKSVACHHFRGTKGRQYSARAINRMIKRGLILCTLKNVSDCRLLSSAIFFLVGRFIKYLFLFKMAELAAILSALRRLMPALVSRFKSRKSWRLTDAEVLAKFEQFSREIQ